MCGIAGALFIFPPEAQQAVRMTAGMVHTLKHRGPDDEGIWGSPRGRAFLGHCRLSIIDLTPEGHQPMTSKNGRYTVSFNGEIYNYLELKSELTNAGVSFRGRSDTEVLLEAVSAWGVEPALEKLAGMFAFALWDEELKKLFLARDRAGKKPMYYMKHGGAFYFASELKAMKTVKDAAFEINPEALYHYLTFGYVPAPSAVYKNVSKVLAGHYLCVDEKLNVEQACYWEMDWGKKRDVSFEGAVEEAETLLREAVKIRLRADVPVGCFLSGGIDSGLLAAFASQELDTPLRTFTVSFKDGAFDESPLAGLVAARYKTDHRVLLLSPDVKQILPEVARAYDEPFADPSAVPSYCISQEARKYLKVVLNGEGGDELFGGYRRHLAMKWFSRYRGFFETVPEGLYRALDSAIPAPQAFRSAYAFAHRFLRGLRKNPYERYIAWCVDGFTEEEKARLYGTSSEHFLSSVRLLSERYGALESLDPIDHFMAMDFVLNMCDDMLVKMDIATMAHGLEGRNPFLDHRVVEWAASLPAAVRLRDRRTKPVLRELAKKYLPPDVVDAPKRGFEIPLIQWLRGDLFDMVHAMCLSSKGLVTQMFDKKYVESLVLEKQKLDPDRWSKRVWLLFMLALWDDAR